MQYLLLIYESEKNFETMSATDGAKLLGEYHTFTEDIAKSGALVGSNRLQTSANATTVRMRDGKLQVTDGPFAETREQLGGYYLVTAKDLDEAIQIAQRIPGARTGSIEVRPVWAM